VVKKTKNLYQLTTKAQRTQRKIRKTTEKKTKILCEKLCGLCASWRVGTGSVVLKKVVPTIITTKAQRTQRKIRKTTEKKPKTSVKNSVASVPPEGSGQVLC
jgi:hypothetical protein